jgi:hypothetical protein
VRQKQFIYWRSTSIKRHRTKFSWRRDLTPGICAVLKNSHFQYFLFKYYFKCPPHTVFFLEDYSIKLFLCKSEEQKTVENHGLVSMLQVGLKTADLVRDISRIGTLHYANIESAATIPNATRNWLIFCIMIPDTSRLNTMNTCITWLDMISIVTVTYCPVRYLSTSTVEPDGSWCGSCGACRVIIVCSHMPYTSKSHIT